MLTHVVVSFALAAVAMGSLKPYYDLADAEKHFENFITKYEKNYESAQEYNRRFEIFKNKLIMINHWNEMYAATFVVNEFADKDPQERTVRYKSTKLKLNHMHKLRVKRKSIDNAPEKLDYRSYGLVSRIKDQGNCNSCYIFSAVGNIEGQYAKLTGQLLSLSDQQALDCAGNPCSEYGHEYRVFSSLSRQKGLVTEANYYPYFEKNPKKHGCHAHKMRPKVKVLGGYLIDTPDEETLKGALYEYGPISIGIYMAPTLYGYKGVTGVYDPHDCDPTKDSDHRVLLVGYSKDSNGTPYWIIKNSWGVDWGENGYLHMAMGKRLCSILKYGAVTVKVARA